MPVSVSVAPVRPEGDEGPSLRWIVRDITERKRVEEALVKSEVKYRTLFDKIDEGFCVIEVLFDEADCPVDYRFLEINADFERQTGIKNAVGRLMREIAPEHEEHWFQIYGNVARTGEPVRFENPACALGHYYDGYAFRIGDPEQRQVGILFNDIRKRKRAEKNLRLSEERSSKAFAHSTAAMSLVRLSDGVYLEVNEAWIEMFGYPRADIIGRTSLQLELWMDAGAREMMYRAIQEKGSMREQEFRMRKASGEQCNALISAELITMGGEQVILGSALDITERKRSEEALRRRTDDLIRLNEEVEAARSEANMYLDIMTHDVRNANNVSSMYADLLVELLAGDQWLYARKLRDAIQRSSGVLRNVATIRRLQQESDRLIPMNVDAVVREEIGNFPGASIRYDGRRVDVLADGLLPVIFTNLLGNAVKFGGPDAEIAIRVEERDGEVLVTVADTGPGVPDEMKERLFTRFERGMARGKGEGLGLFIVRTLVERYGGKVWVEDRVPGHPEEGAAFRFTLQKVA